jgi:hypothetical protein
MYAVAGRARAPESHPIDALEEPLLPYAEANRGAFPPSETAAAVAKARPDVGLEAERRDLVVLETDL